MVSTGMAAQKSTLSSARPSPAKPSIRCWTVSSIQFWIHHCAFAGTNDGCTSARYLRCWSPPIDSMLFCASNRPLFGSTGSRAAAKTSALRYASSHAAQLKAEKCGRSGCGSPWKNAGPSKPVSSWTMPGCTGARSRSRRQTG
ncbi:hypothetical protein ACFQ07_00825 [Actinomadura adrarensis]|uniref:Uncharacterized protein n=1 Tax=Actinomadura adrarensis TaxID=1819600 RepID=A0ABW3CB85_9ACTN